MRATLLVWNDRDPANAVDYERWYNREHLLERVAVPGFRSGRRYEALRGDRAFFSYYEIDHAEVMSSPAYLERVNSPTPWTVKSMASFFGMVRTGCDIAQEAGMLTGGHVVTARFGGHPSSSDASAEVIRTLVSEDGVASARLLLASYSQTPKDTTEVGTRPGADETVGGALMIECVRQDDALRWVEAADDLVRRTVRGDLGAVSVGAFSLLCIREAAIRDRGERTDPDG